MPWKAQAEMTSLNLCAMSCGVAALACGEVVMACGEAPVALACEEAAMACGEAAMACGKATWALASCLCICTAPVVVVNLSSSAVMTSFLLYSPTSISRCVNLPPIARPHRPLGDSNPQAAMLNTLRAPEFILNAFKVGSHCLSLPSYLLILMASHLC